jgi:periplasmic divalent cation tolerance protein
MPIAVYITHESMDEARRVATHLVKERLAACANFFPIESVYWWQGKMESAQEVVSIVKAPAEHWERIKSEVERIHTYDVPCIVRFDVEANKAFETWIDQETI